MSYLTQTRSKKKPTRFIFYLSVFLFAISILFFSFINPFFLNTSATSKGLFESISIFTYFRSKNSLNKENIDLRKRVFELTSLNVSKDALINENNIFKEKFNNIDIENLVYANVLERPGFSPYDFLVIDEGLSKGLTVGLNVFYGDFVIGEIIEVYNKSAKVEVYSSPGKSFSVLLGEKKIPANATGVGGGSFEVLLPKGVDIKENDLVVLEDDPLKVFGVVSAILNIEKDDFEHIYFTLPINLYEITDVLVAI